MSHVMGALPTATYGAHVPLAGGGKGGGGPGGGSGGGDATGHVAGLPVYRSARMLAGKLFAYASKLLTYP
jgi:hypothetical protein